MPVCFSNSHTLNKPGGRPLEVPSYMLQPAPPATPVTFVPRPRSPVMAPKRTRAAAAAPAAPAGPRLTVASEEMARSRSEVMTQMWREGSLTDCDARAGLPYLPAEPRPCPGYICRALDFRPDLSLPCRVAPLALLAVLLCAPAPRREARRHGPRRPSSRRPPGCGAR